jgi:ubiquinone/menaquinone biosynthesis C-methylase UbiE
VKSKTPDANLLEVRAGSSPGEAQQKLIDAHFQSHAARWRNVYNEASVEGAIYRERLVAILRWVDELAVPREDRSLEIGCGAGLSVVALARRGYLVAAVDSVADMLNSTQQYAAGAGVTSSVFTSLGDAHNLAFPNSAFGLVLAIGVIPYLHSPKRALAEMARVLAPGGFLLVTAANRSRLNHALDPWLCPALQPMKRAIRAILGYFRRPQSEPLAPSLRLGSLRELEGWLSSVGLSKVRTKTVGFLPLTFHYRPVVGERASISLNRWLQWLADHNVPGIRSSGMDYLVLARKTPRTTLPLVPTT